MGIDDELPPEEGLEDNLDVDMVDDPLNQDVPPQMGQPPMGPDGQPMVPPQMGAPQMGVPAAPDPLMGQHQSMRQLMRDMMKKHQRKYMDDQIGQQTSGQSMDDFLSRNKAVYTGFAADLARSTK